MSAMDGRDTGLVKVKTHERETVCQSSGMARISLSTVFEKVLPRVEDEEDGAADLCQSSE